MRIAFDARPLLGERTGVSVWLEGLVRGLAASTSWELVACLPRRESIGLDDLDARVQVCAPPLPLLGTIWLHTMAAPLVAGRADVYLGTLGILPRRLPMPAALVVHDLTPFTRPRHHTLANRYCFNAYFTESLERADVLVCVSNATLSRLALHFPRHGRRARVIPEAPDAFFSPADSVDEGREVRRRLAGGRPFIVQLGTLEPRKGVATVIAAHSRLLATRPDGPDLVLAGKRGWGGAWLERALAEHQRRDRVHITGYLDRRDVRALFRHAEAVVMAAEEEGFGLPLAEALACGAVCVASDEPALVELAAGAAEHFPRGDAEALAMALARVLAAGDRARRRAAALARAAALGWDAPLASWRHLLHSLGAGTADFGDL